MSAAKDSLKSRLLVWFVDNLAPLLLRMLGASWQIKLVGAEHLNTLSGQPYILALWHECLLPSTYYFAPEKLAVIVSRSQDGELIARVLQHLGYSVLRGSSSRGGARVLLQAITSLRAGQSLAVTPDGPKGPRRQLQPGLLAIAVKSAVPILPVGIGADRMWVLSSWDRFRVPKPFARVRVELGRPLQVNRAELDQNRAAITSALTAQLTMLTDAANQNGT